MDHRIDLNKNLIAILLCALSLTSRFAHAQRADENIITSAEDVFGTSLGGENIGLYDAYGVRGFSPSTAGNLRIEGLYFDQKADMTSRIQSGYGVHIGPAAQGYLFPAPTGIVDYSLRRSGGKDLLSSVLTRDSRGTTRWELDGQLSTSDSQFSTAIGVSLTNDHFATAGSDHRKAIGLVPRWRPSKNIELTAFWGRSQVSDETALPIYVPQSDLDLPPAVKRTFYPGPAWALGERFADNMGLMGLATFGNWTLRGGLFHSMRDTRTAFANLYLDVTPQGTGDHVILADPPQRNASTSGEVRISRKFGSANLQQLLLASLRWRNAHDSFSGTDYFDAGTANLNDQLDVPAPTFNFSERSFQYVTQQTIGLNYNLRVGTVAELGAGLQHADYSKKDMQPGIADGHTQANPWLQSLTMSVHALPSLTVYGSYYRGLEDNGTAPDSAANRGQPLPIIKSRQLDAGIRWSPNDHTRLIVGYFEIAKPYYTADSNKVYRLLGQEMHRGIEFSLNTTPANGLTVIFGGVYMDPRIDDAQNGVGRTPAGIIRNHTELYVDYVLPFAPQLSLNFNVTKYSSAPTSASNLNYEKFPVVFNGGGRFRFKLKDTPCMLRLYATNMTNEYFWYFAGAGAFQPSNPVVSNLSFAADF